jgi:hypothetical protein
MKARSFVLPLLLLFILIIPVFTPVEGLGYYESDGKVYVEKQSRFRLTLHGTEDFTYFAIYFNASDGQKVNWVISVLEGGHFQLYFMEGHKNVEIMIMIAGGLLFEYMEYYSEDTDVKRASGSFRSRDEGSRFTLLLLNEGSEEAQLDVDVSVSGGGGSSDLQFVLYCCGVLLLFFIVPSAIATAIKFLIKGGSRKQQVTPPPASETAYANNVYPRSGEPVQRQFAWDENNR